jgi:RNA polymerase sigma factor (TIGR02999 family)
MAARATEASREAYGHLTGQQHGVILDRMSDVSRILDALQRGDSASAAELLPLVYDELRRLAMQRLAHEKPGQTLQATALVHEAYLRLVGSDGGDNWNGRGHFFAAAAEAMRRILIENARRKRTLKQGGAQTRQEFDEALLATPDTHEDLEALDEALQLLAADDPVKARLVELRYFAGLTSAEAAAALGISTATAERYWNYARAWLRRKMAP